MNYADHALLVKTLREAPVSRSQLIDLWDAISLRVCQMDAPELESAIHDISDADEALKDGLAALDAREARFAPPDECTLAKQEAEMWGFA